MIITKQYLTTMGNDDDEAPFATDLLSDEEGTAAKV